MIVQSMILPNDVCDVEEIYIRKSGNVVYGNDQIEMDAESVVRTDTYMNILDAGVWECYTGVKEWKLKLDFWGTGEVRLMRWSEEKREIVIQKNIESTDWQTHVFHFNHSGDNGLYYWEVESNKNVKIKNAIFEIDRNLVNNLNEIRLGLIICTFHRQENLNRNLDALRKSSFFDRESELYGKLYVCIVDNGSEIPLIKEEHIALYHNPNTGGSGGFTRGIEELRNIQNANKLSHVIFMDDDVELLMETLYRLYAFVSLIKAEYKDNVVAGRMFRLDQRHIQYTAAEVWNRGEIKHIGWNCDMTQLEALAKMNDNSGAEYGGWWFCCYPMGFVMQNTPLPFFLHCDDVEYGLRHGGTPIVLNGIQVWHETYEYRQSPVMVYYDTRNSLIVNKMYGMLLEKNKLLISWKEQITEQHTKKKYLIEYELICGLRDFCKGLHWLNKVDAERQHRKMYRTRPCRIKNAIMWRIVWFYADRKIVE